MAAKIFRALAGINKKLGRNAKFSDVVDNKQIEEAEKTASRMQVFFQQAIADDFKELKRTYNKLKPHDVSNREYNKIYDLAFSIKSRAGNAGLALASKVASSLYQFCDKLLESEFDIEGYDVIKVHYHALEQIFTGSFNVDDAERSLRLLNGLEALSEKIIAEATPESEPEAEGEAPLT